MKNNAKTSRSETQRAHLLSRCFIYDFVLPLLYLIYVYENSFLVAYAYKVRFSQPTQFVKCSLKVQNEIGKTTFLFLYGYIDRYRCLRVGNP